MKILYCVFYTCLISLLFFACSNQPPDQNKNVINEESKSIDALELYNKNCKLCHGSDGKRNLSGAKDLSISILSDEEAFQMIEKGSPERGMRAYGNTLSEVEINALVDYIKQLRK